ncbi:hypothetical protein SVIOM342S_03482 [Streptomyces violaceorubidus]
MRTAEEAQHRQVGLPVPAVRGRVDEVDVSVGAPQHVAVPQVAVAGSAVGGARQLGQPLQTRSTSAASAARTVPESTARRIRQHAVRGVPAGPVVPGDIAHRGPPDVRLLGPAGRRGTERRCPGGVQPGQVPSEPDRRLRTRLAARHPVGDQRALVHAVHRGDRHRPGPGQPAQPRGLGARRTRILRELDHHGAPVVEADLGEPPGQRALTDHRPPGEPGRDGRGRAEGTHTHDPRTRPRPSAPTPRPTRAARNSGRARARPAGSASHAGRRPHRTGQVRRSAGAAVRREVAWPRRGPAAADTVKSAPCADRATRGRGAMGL